MWGKDPLFHQSPTFMAPGTGFMKDYFSMDRRVERASHVAQLVKHLPAVQRFRFSYSSVAHSRPTLWTHGLQHAKLPCPSPAPGIYPNSFPLSQWCHSTITSSVVPFSSCLQSFPASEAFPVSQFFTSGGQSIGVSASTSVLPMNIQDWFPLGWTGLIALLSKGLSTESSPTPQFKSINSSAFSFLYSPTLTSIHDYWKSHNFD